LKFGLVGTGYWARVTHAAVLASEPAADFTAVWGRSAGKAAAVGEEFGVRPYSDFADFLRHVDAVAFAVPPDVQAELAVQAADAGKHLLLEKPVATSAAGAARLVGAVERAGVSSVVFFTARFTPTTREWLASVRDGGWEGAWARWIVSVFGHGSPYAASPWRREKGALWDVGPRPKGSDPVTSSPAGPSAPLREVTRVGGSDRCLRHLHRLGLAHNRPRG
jgi:predicted dehydrogenase